MIRTASRAFALGLGLATALAAGPAAADYRTVEKRQYGAWTVEASRDSADGSHACSVANQSMSGDLLFMLSLLERPNQLFLSLSDRRWNMARGQTGRVRVVIDGRSWNASMRAVTNTQLVSTLSTSSSSTENFLRAFMRGSRMEIHLPSGQRLTAGLSGTTRAINEMVNCRSRYFATASRGGSGKPTASGKPSAAPRAAAPRAAAPPPNPLGGPSSGASGSGASGGAKD